MHLSYVSTHYLKDYVDAIDDTDVAYIVDIDFCLELEPATHIQIQKHFNDSIADLYRLRL